MLKTSYVKRQCKSNDVTWHKQDTRNNFDVITWFRISSVWTILSTTKPIRLLHWYLIKMQFHFVIVSYKSAHVLETKNLIYSKNINYPLGIQLELLIVVIVHLRTNERHFFHFEIPFFDERLWAWHINSFFINLFSFDRRRSIAMFVPLSCYVFSCHPSLVIPRRSNPRGC